MTDVTDQMPSGEYRQECDDCGEVVSLVARACSRCGAQLREDAPAPDAVRREALADVATIKSLLMDNRPLEALRIAADAEDRLQSLVDGDGLPESEASDSAVPDHSVDVSETADGIVDGEIPDPDETSVMGPVTEREEVEWDRRDEAVEAGATAAEAMAGVRAEDVDETPDDEGAGSDEDSEGEEQEEKDYSGEDYGVFTVRDYGLPLSGVQNHFDTDRVTVVDRPYGADLVAGTDPEGPDYSVGQSNIQLGNPAQDLLGVDVGDELQAIPDGNAVRLEVLDSDADAGAEDDHRVGDVIDDVEETDQDDSGPDGGQGDSDDVDLPDNLSADGLREFVEESETNPYLGVLADKFDIESEDRMRTILHELGLYDSVIDASEPRGGT